MTLHEGVRQLLCKLLEDPIGFENLIARMDEELSKLFTVEKSRGDSHEEDVRKAREIIRKTTEISR